MATLLHNKKATFNYETLEQFEAGMELFGFEVKALRNKMGSLEGAHVTIRGNEAFLLGATIPPFQPANTPESYDPTRNRRLLLRAKEIGELSGFEDKKGLTIIPISVYNKGRNLKLSIALVRGKKEHDKRETIKQRESKINTDRQMKEFNR